MDGERLRNFWSQEVRALLATYKQFETLVPSPSGAGAYHRGEDGRYVESLVRQYLQKFLPKELEVLTGFVLRPAVKLGKKNKVRKWAADENTSQLDIIVYNTFCYPVFQRMGEAVIVPPEGVVGIISIKKTLHAKDIKKEVKSLMDASQICRCDERKSEDRRRGPFLALVATASKIKHNTNKAQSAIFDQLKSVYGNLTPFDHMVGFLGDLASWHVFKARPERNEARFFYVESNNEHIHQGFQFLLSGILSVHYDETRNTVKRPGFTAFPSRRAKQLGAIPFPTLR